MNSKHLASQLLSTLLGVAWLAAPLPPALAAGGTVPKSTAKDTDKAVELPKSTFITPGNKTEGRDPFHPNATYIYNQGGGSKNGGGKQPVLPALDLVLKAITGVPGNRLATINTRTFAKGEEGEMTVSGSKVQIQILDILEDAVILSVNGEQRELRFRRSFQ
jgi:hypothetical protein